MSRTWREAYSLQTLEDEIQRYYPGTTTWELGDTAHQATWSDHNPNGSGVVCAKDILADGGLNLQELADHLTSNPHPNLRYVIFNHKIYERSNGFKPEDYHGKSGHEHHLHASVGNGPDGRSTTGYDNTTTWHIDDLKAGKPSKPHEPAKPSKPSTGTKKLGDEMPTLRRGDRGKNVRRLQGLLTANGYKTTIDGIFGDDTEDRLYAFQHDHARPADKIAGPITWNALLGL
jgi:hypothetical protein